VNKKQLTLSVLSTALVASMAASAFAAPKAGVYIGGNVDKYYSFSALSSDKNIDTFLDEMLDNVADTVYVSDKGEARGGLMLDLLFASPPSEHFVDVTNEMFADIDGADGFYTVDEDGTVGTVKEQPDPTDTPGELKVESVSAINGTQIVVKFNKAVDEDSLFTDVDNGVLTAGVFSITPVDGTLTLPLSGKLSADGKTLTVTTSAAVAKRYRVVVENLKAEDGADISKYDEVVTFAADTTAPTIVSTVKKSSSTYTVTFSEPVTLSPSVSYKYADGSPVAAGDVFNDFVAGTPTDKITFTLGNGVTAGKTVIATLIGAQDTASNLLNPNPATVSFVKGALDGVVPTVSTITQTGANTFTVKFSEELAGTPIVEVAGIPAAVVKDATDPTLYKATTTGAPLDGATTVVVKTFSDLSGELGKDTSKVVVFTKDVEAPKVTSSNAVVDAADSKQYLEVTFDKDVTLVAGATVSGAGSFVKDFVTTPVTPAATPVNYKSPSNKKVIRVQLATFLGAPATDVEGATYNLDLTFAGVTSATGVAVDTSKATFTRVKDGVPASTDVVGVVSVVPDAADNNKVEVTFNKAVDGASATNAANYKIDGAVVESVTLKAAVTAAGVTTQVAVLNLKSGSNEFTGTRNINISGVKALGSSKIMEPYHVNNVELNENVAPVITSAQLVDTETVVLTFSEAVINAAGGAADFELLIGGKTVVGNVDIDTETVAAPGATTVTLTLEDVVTADDIAKGLSIKALSTLDIKDAAGNKPVIKTPVTVQ